MIVLPRQEVIIFFCEISKQVSALSIRAKTFKEIKPYIFDYDFRVERELSKQYGAFIVYAKDKNIYVVYAVQKNGSINPVFSEYSLKNSGLSISDDRVIVAVPRNRVIKSHVLGDFTLTKIDISTK